MGCLFKDGIVLGADTRATAGPIVADKNCEKASFFYAMRLLYDLTICIRSTTSQSRSAAVVQGRLQIQNSLQT